MSHFLDTLPLNFSRQSAQELLATPSDSIVAYAKLSLKK